MESEYKLYAVQETSIDDFGRSKRTSMSYVAARSERNARKKVRERVSYLGGPLDVSELSVKDFEIKVEPLEDKVSS